MSNAMEYGQLHHVEYYVDDLKTSNVFWGWFLSQFNYHQSNAWEGGVSWAHPNGTYLVFVQVEERFLNAGNTRQGNGLNHIALQGGSPDHLRLLKAQLQERHIKISIERDGEYLCFEDPNGFAVEVYAQA